MLSDIKDIYSFDSITLNVCNVCNLHCSYCFEKNKTLSFMNTNTVGRILNKAYNPDKGLIVNLFGGEPLMNWEVVKYVICWAGGKDNVHVGITTNGTIMTKEIANYIKSRNVHLLLSIDGKPETHNKNRSNSFPKVRDGIEILQKCEVEPRNIEARMTILPEDAKNLYENVLYLINKLGLKYICPMPVTDQEWSNEYLVDLYENYVKLMNWYIDKFKDSDSPDIQIKNVSDMMMECISEYIGDNEMCPIASHNWCSFDADGGMYQCHQMPTMPEEDKEKFLIGDIWSGKIETDKMISPLRFQYAKEGCRNCPSKSICKGGCPVENYRLNGLMTACGEGYCDTTRALGNAVRRFHMNFFFRKPGKGSIYKKLYHNLNYKIIIDKLNNHVDLNNDKEIVKVILELTRFLNDHKKEELIESFRAHGDYVLSLVCSYLISRKGGNVDVKLLKNLC